MLARIDERDFKVALDQAQADVAAAQPAITSKQAQLGVQQATIDAAKATIDVDQATATFAAQENKRYSDLRGDRLRQRAECAAGAIAHRRRPGRDPARYRQPRLRPEAGRPAQGRRSLSGGAALALARSRLGSQAQLNLDYTSIIAPIEGVVGNRTLRTGQFVQAGTQLMSVVPVAGAYVVANFKKPSSQTYARPGG